MPEPTRVVTLTELADGAAIELFQKALDDVLRSIADPNTDHKAKRTIRLEFVFGTNEDRNVSDVEVKCKTSLPGVKGVHTIVYIGKDQGQLVAVEQPRQTDMFPSPRPAPRIEMVARPAAPTKEGE